MEDTDTQVYAPRQMIRLSPHDNVVVAAQSLPAGAAVDVDGVIHTLDKAVGLGHKIAAKALPQGAKIIKCNVSIGSATCDIQPGQHIHMHNMKSDYLPTFLRGDTQETPGA